MRSAPSRRAKLVGESDAESFAVNLGTGRGYRVLKAVHAFETASGRQVKYDVAPRCYAP